MELTHIIALLATGIVVGFASGLLGVGGCFIMIPVQFWVYTAMGLPADIAIRVAFGTNLFVVLPTAMSGAWGHQRKGAVWWKAALVLGGCGLIGAYGGATIATHMPGSILKVIFGATILAGGVRMLTAKPPEVIEEPRDNPWLWVAWGLPLGIITGLIGIGGGVLMIPVMVLALKFKMHQAVGTSTAMMILTSLGGLIGYIVNGIGVAGIPSPHIGYVHIWSWLALTITSVGMAQVGATTAHKLPAKQLRWIFIAVMFYMGLKMIGVFDWLGLPI
ncbi:MAG: sulfite exporter TauE/SafE family protein [Dehalococcoidia bacterium]|nr:sulfite exporter TauE/SafE family protein [Dehalococcoidia bacterium]